MMNLKHKRQHHQQRPKLDRRNAAKNIDYDAYASALTSASSSSFSDDRPPVYKTRSLDLVPISDRTSFRIEGIDGEFDRICRSLGLSGPEDFSIPVAAWEARKASSPSGNLATSRFNDRSELLRNGNDLYQVSKSFEDRVGVDVSDDESKLGNDNSELLKSFEDSVWVSDDEPKIGNDLYELSRRVDDMVSGNKDKSKNEIELKLDGNEAKWNEVDEDDVNNKLVSNGGWGIKGNRPPKLAPPPIIVRPVVDDTSSTWDIFRAFGPEDNRETDMAQDAVNSLVDGGEIVGEEEERVELVKNETRFGLGSLTDDNDDGSTGLVAENIYSVSPNGSFRCNISSWQKGDFLGSGSFGTVYEGFTDDGIFFAVKEVSLLDRGSQGQQSIYQLEQEIFLLSQFQHENIVRYLGTDKDDGKLYIFLELVTKGSLARLYQKYQLRDSQVSSYTRQILSGLNYLHCRDVVHRDIKCANILVDVSGSVKLADFGLAKATKLNDIKSCKGTPFWMAPEVVRQMNTGYGRAADIWSLGCTVLEMLTGQIPYSHLEGMQALFRIGKGELPPIPNTLSGDARDFILKCLKVNPDHRPTAAELLEHPFVKKPPSTLPSPASPYRHGVLF